MSNYISAVIVTHNRKDLLQECLKAVLNQSVPVHKAIVIDNASTDGTQKMLESTFDDARLDVYVMPDNLGGAGGFFEGIKIAKTTECDWVWIMDDDTIPQKDCLEKLILAEELFANRKNSFYASSVFGPNGEPMNVPEIDEKKSQNGYSDWGQFLNHRMVKIKKATFVSVLINSNAIEKVGFPCKKFFIWGDDFEYTLRMTRYYGNAYLVGDSIAIHKRSNVKSINIRNETDINRIKLYHYHYRNNGIISRYYGEEKMWFLRQIKKLITGMTLLKTENGKEKYKELVKGIRESIFNYNDFKIIIDNELKRETV